MRAEGYGSGERTDKVKVWRSMVQGCAVALLVCGTMTAQESLGAPGRRRPSVTVAAIPLTTIARGESGWVSMHFEVGAGFHVNSHTPTEKYLIPTSLAWDPPTDIVIQGVTYPKGELRSFAFAPNTSLSVYAGAFTTTVQVHPLSNVVPTRYMVHGRLKYQACDNAACYPPRTLPVAFEIKVVRGVSRHRRPNPPQSPGVHN